MQILLIVFFIIINVSIWPVNRIVLSKGSSGQRLGLSISFFAMVFSLILALILKQPLFIPASIGFGFIMAVGFAFGYCIFVMKAMECGPLGPTVLFNNLGLIWPSLITIFLSGGTVKHTWMIYGGILLTVIAMALTTVKSRSGQKERIQVTKKWIAYVELGWVGAGISMSGQLFASMAAPESPIALSVWAFGFSTLMLMINTFANKLGFPAKREILAGVYTGLIQPVNILLLFALLAAIPAYIVFPVIVATPIFITMIIGSLFFKERLSRFMILGCVAGITGIVLLSVVGNL